MSKKFVKKSIVLTTYEWTLRKHAMPSSIVKELELSIYTFKYPFVENYDSTLLIGYAQTRISCLKIGIRQNRNKRIYISPTPSVKIPTIHLNGEMSVSITPYLSKK